MGWSHIGTFVAGVATGALGEFFAHVLLDTWRERRAKNKVLRTFHDLARDMPKLFKELKADLAKPENRLVREFYPLHGNQKPVLLMGHLALALFYDEHEGLSMKLSMLEDAGFTRNVVDVHGSPAYRMSEAFVDLLKSEEV